VFSRISVTLSLWVVVFIQVSGQDVQVRGKFHADSIKIGQAVPFSLTARYPASLNVLFPDTGFSFAPFEVQGKKYFQTKTLKNVSYDSVVYFLTTYEIDSVQQLQLPVFVVHTKDCTQVNSNTSSIILKQLVKAKYDSLTAEKLPLKENANYINVRWLLNYPLVLILAAVLVIALIVAWIIFGKRIRRYFKLRKFMKNHKAFVLKFSQSVGELQHEFSSGRAESIFVLWKKYMETLVSQPYTRYTAREILQMEHDETLGPTLQALNKIIYAGVNPASEEPFTNLLAYTEQQFLKKLEEIKHG
jgi:hypothetical protein